MEKWALHLVFCLLLVVNVVQQCQGQTTAQIHMRGVKGTVTFSLASGSGALIADVRLIQGAAKFTGVDVIAELMPSWVYYDREDKCSQAALGDAYATTTINSGFPEDNEQNEQVRILFNNIKPSSLAEVEGYSLRLRGSETVCATIQRGGHFTTAVAEFRDRIYGTVHFRRLNGVGHSTRILISLSTRTNVFPGQKWAIVNNMADCQKSYNSLYIYNPLRADSVGCSAVNPNRCAVGALSDKFNPLTINTQPRIIGYTDANLAITGTNGIKDKILVIYNTDGSTPNFCAPIRVYTGLSASVQFSDSGVYGSMTFNQPSPLDATTTVINIQGLQQQAKGYHVHKYPRPVNIKGILPCSGYYVSGHLNPFNINLNVNYPSPTSSTNDMYESGDLSSKYGTMANLNNIQGNFTDWNLPLYGQNSIIGRSVVIHKNDGLNTRWICANIEPSYSIVGAVAKFRHPVIGNIYFTQAADDAGSQTTVFAQLDYLYGGTPTTNAWRINQNSINASSITDAPRRCGVTPPMYNPVGTSANTGCTAATPMLCQMGDMSGKLGMLSIRTQGTTENFAESFFTDSNLPLSGSHSIIGKSLVIYSDQSATTILACADIEPLHGPVIVANFSGVSLQGTVEFSQMPGYGLKKTIVKNHLNGLAAQHGLAIYDLPPMGGDTPCSDIGNVYNPLGTTTPGSSSGRDMNIPIGNLARFGIVNEWSTYNLPLSGLTSVMGRSVAVRNSNGNVVTCARLNLASNFGLPQTAVIRMPGLVGSAHLYQMMYNDGTLSETSIYLNFKNSNNIQTNRHNWHVHVSPVYGDASAASGRCASAKGHFDPYNAIANKAVYDVECKESAPFHCEVGDQANKLGTYNLGGGAKVFTDVDLPLDGQLSVLGRSMVIHAADRTAPRIACGDVIPNSGDPVAVNFKTPANLDMRAAAAVYAKAIGIPHEAVVMDVTSTVAGGNTMANVYFPGRQRERHRQMFVNFISDQSRRESLGDYSPIVNPTDKAGMIQAPIVLLILTLVAYAAFV